MKKIIIVLVLLLMAFSLCAENLDEFAAWAKEIPTMYEAIKYYAIEEWEGNADLVIKEINSQSYYMFLAVQIVDNNPDNLEIQQSISFVIDFIVNEDWVFDWAIVWNDLLKMEKGE